MREELNGAFAVQRLSEAQTQGRGHLSRLLQWQPRPLCGDHRGGCEQEKEGETGENSVAWGRLLDISKTVFWSVKWGIIIIPNLQVFWEYRTMWIIYANKISPLSSWALKITSRRNSCDFNNPQLKCARLSLAREEQLISPNILWAGWNSLFWKLLQDLQGPPAWKQAPGANETSRCDCSDKLDLGLLINTGQRGEAGVLDDPILACLKHVNWRQRNFSQET